MSKEKREERKLIDKSVQQSIKQTAKRMACKVISICIYEKINSYFAYSTFFTKCVEDEYVLTFRIYLKPYNYDDIFWEVFDMKDNSRQPISLRAIGAFQSPSVLVKENTYIISDINSIELICIEAVNDFKNESRKFVDRTLLEYKSFDFYVLEQSSKIKDTLLEMIAYISLQRYEDAERIAQAELNKGNGGRFENGGISINSYIVKYCKKNKLP